MKEIILLFAIVFMIVDYAGAEGSEVTPWK